MKKSYNRLIILPFITIVVLVLSIMYLRSSSQRQLSTSYYEQWEHTYIKETDHGKSAYIDSQPKAKHPVSISEGHGYGMLICALEGKKGKVSQQEFEKLNNYYLNHRMDSTALMSWKQTIYKNKIKDEKNNATDGDIYIAYALIQAAKAWPDSKDKYLGEAKAILNDIFKYNYNDELKILTVGNWAGKDSKYYNMIRTSDVMPVQFDAFYHTTHDKRWLEVKASMLGHLKQLSDQHKSGLVPDFAWVTEDSAKPVGPNTVASKYDGEYYYNACRVPYNLARAEDEESKAILNKMMDYFLSKNRIYAGYYLNGKIIDRHQSRTFGAPILFAAICNKKQYDKLFEQEKFILMEPISRNNYYEAVLTVLVAV